MLMNFKKLITFPIKNLKKYRISYLFYSLVKLFTLGVAVYQPFVWAYVLNSIYSMKKEETLKNIIILLSSYLLQAITKYIGEIYKNRINYGMVTDLKVRMIEAVINFKMSVINKTKVGEFISKFHSDVVEVVEFWVAYLPNVTIEIVKVLVIGVLISIVDFRLFIIMLLGSIGFAFAFIKFGNEIRRRYTEFRKVADIYFSNMYETMNNIREIKNLGIRSKATKKSAKIFDDIRVGELHYNNLGVASELITSLIDTAVIFIVLFWSAYLVISGDMTVVKFVVFFTYASHFSASIKEIARINSKVQQSNVSFERVYDIMFDSSNKENTTLQTEVIDNIDAITMNDVTFSYDSDENKVIRNINLVFEANTFNAIVGPSGNGKSTILHLLNRLYDGYTGNISFGCIDLRKINETSLRKIVTRVFQEPLLFNTSINDNFKLVNERASTKDIIECCKKAYIHDFILTLPEGYDTLIQENANNISVGQKQRIAIARALLVGAKVLLFDEITSSLDNEAQEKIVQTLENIRKDHIIIMVSHKITNIVNADNIIVINEGKIIETGSHSDLMVNCALYKNLYELEKN